MRGEKSRFALDVVTTLLRESPQLLLKNGAPIRNDFNTKYEQDEVLTKDELDKLARLINGKAPPEVKSDGIFKNPTPLLKPKPDRSEIENANSDYLRFNRF